MSIDELDGFLQDGYGALFFGSHRQLDVRFGSERVVQKVFDQTGENRCGIFALQSIFSVPRSPVTGPTTHQPNGASKARGALDLSGSLRVSMTSSRSG